MSNQARAWTKLTHRFPPSYPLRVAVSSISTVATHSLDYHSGSIHIFSVIPINPLPTPGAPFYVAQPTPSSPYIFTSARLFLLPPLISPFLPPVPPPPPTAPLPPPPPPPPTLFLPPLDLSDGYIHLSTAPQVALTLNRFFGDVPSVVLLRLETERVGSWKRLIWERTSSGEGE